GPRASGHAREAVGIDRSCHVTKSRLAADLDALTICTCTSRTSWVEEVEPGFVNMASCTGRAWGVGWDGRVTELPPHAPRTAIIASPAVSDAAVMSSWVVQVATSLLLSSSLDLRFSAQHRP